MSSFLVLNTTIKEQAKPPQIGIESFRNNPKLTKSGKALVTNFAVLANFKMSLNLKLLY